MPLPARSPAQGAYFFATGLWPILHMRSFEAVTGRKTDRWLVKTVGALIAVIGGALVAGAQRPPDASLRILGGASAAALAVVDLNYVARGVIPLVYLVDAIPEFALVAAWMGTARRRRTPNAERRTSDGG